MKLNVNVFRTGGKPHTLKKFELTEGQHVPIPEGSHIFFVEWVQERGTEFIEVWAAVPDDSILLSEKRNISGEPIPTTVPPISTLGTPAGDLTAAERAELGDDIATPTYVEPQLDDEYEEEFDPNEY